MAEHNQRFRRRAARPENHHRRAPGATKLDRIFRLESERVISDDWVVRCGGRFLQLESKSPHYAPARSRVVVCEGPDGRVDIEYRGHGVSWREIEALEQARTSEPQRVAERPAPAMKRKGVP